MSLEIVLGLTALGYVWIAYEIVTAPREDDPHGLPYGDVIHFGAIPRADLPGARVSPLSQSAGEPLLSDPFHTMEIYQ